MMCLSFGFIAALCEPGFIHVHGSCLHVDKSLHLSWLNAKLHCMNLGAQLINMTSQLRFNLVKTWITGSKLLSANLCLDNR